MGYGGEGGEEVKEGTGVEGVGVMRSRTFPPRSCRQGFDYGLFMCFGRGVAGYE